MLTDRLAETSALFRHQARAAEDEFGEATYHWPDQRGQGFARGILGPKVQLMQPAMAAIADQLRGGEAAVISGGHAEQAMAAVEIAAQETSAAADAASRLSMSAEQLAGTAYHQGRAAETDARRLTASIQALGPLPI